MSTTSSLEVLRRSGVDATKASDRARIPFRTTNPSPSTTLPPFWFVNVTWGENHTGLFLDVALPTQLSQCNLPAFENDRDAVYKIFTTRKDAERIRGSSSFAKLQAIITTEIIEIDLTAPGGSHTILTNCHKAVIREAAKTNAAIVFLAPDIVVADGSFANLRQLVAEGKKAVMLAGVRLDKESFVPTFLKACRPQEEAVASVRPRDLVGLAIDHLHPISRSLEWPPKSNWPSHLYWRVADEGFLARCYHLHPILVVAGEGQVDFSSTIDGDYVLNAYPQDQVYVVDDSDEVLLFEISPHCYLMGDRPDPIFENKVGLWAGRHANRLHRRMFERTLSFHQGGQAAAWERERHSVEQIAARIQNRTRLWDILAPLITLAVFVLRPPVRFGRRVIRFARSRCGGIRRRMIAAIRGGNTGAK